MSERESLFASLREKASEVEIAAANLPRNDANRVLWDTTRTLLRLLQALTVAESVVARCHDSNCSMPDGHPGKHYDMRDGAAW